MALSVSRLVRVTVNLSPLAAARRSFGVLMVAGDSNVISGAERFRTYLTYEGVATDFGINAPEAKAAALYFSQVPKPQTLMIGRWLRTATAGFNLGGILSLAEQTIGNFTAITSGGLNISIDGVAKTLTGINLSGAANLNAVATLITTAFSSSAVCTWNGKNFTITSATTGIASIVTFGTTGGGTDLSVPLKLTSALSQGLTTGFAAETPAECTVALANKSALWYGLMFAAATQPTDGQSTAVSDVIEAFTLKRMYGVTITNTNVLSSVVTNDLASVMKLAAYKQSFCQYSQNAYAVASFFGRAFSVNFAANRSTITMMYKQEPSVTPEDLDEQQASTLKDKRCNVFVSYVNDTSIIQYGVMSGPAWFDEIHGLDWFQDAVQNSCYNTLYQSKTKIPQTDAGINILTNAVAGVCDESVNNGLVAPGTWTSPSTFGTLEQGQFLKTGYYIYANSLALQSQADREARIAPPIQVAIKLAGAIQELDVIVDVNR